MPSVLPSPPACSSAASTRPRTSSARWPRPPATPRRASCARTSWPVTDSAAETRAAQERLMYYLRAVTPANLAPQANLPPNLAFMADISRRVQTMQPEDLGERSIVAGDAAHCVEVLKRVEAAGIEEVILYFNYGAYPHADTVRMMERFARDVMPHFAPDPAPTGV